VLAAYRLLRDEGVLEFRRGRGAWPMMAAAPGRCTIGDNVQPSSTTRNTTIAVAASFAVLSLAGCSSASGTSPSASGQASQSAGSTATKSTGSTLAFPIVDTGQTSCYSSAGAKIDCPAAAAADYGQDAQTDGTAPSYTKNGDGTITDNVTGLVWLSSADSNGDGKFDTTDKLSKWAFAVC
jgi:hypothetical protein